MSTAIDKLKSHGYEPATMPKKTKEKWLTALRSGEYEQTNNSLYDKRTQSFCCLGVLEHCLTGGVEYVDGIPRGLPTDSWYKGWKINTDNVGMSVYYMGAVRSLDELNDGGLSFKQIANIIEKQVIGK